MANLNIGSHDHLHAVGVMIAAWNMVETAFQAFIQLVFPYHMKAGIHTFELLGNDERVKLIRSQLADIATKEEQDLLEYFIKSADICKVNRNILAHASYPNQPPGDRIMITKGTSKDRSTINTITLDVSAVREMADATYSIAAFGFDLWSTINLRLSNAYWIARGVTPKFFPSLPGKPSLPRKWEQVRDGLKPDLPQPRSSQP